MNDSNDGLIAFVLCVIALTIAFILGFGSPKYKVSTDIKTKNKQ